MGIIIFKYMFFNNGLEVFLTSSFLVRKSRVNKIFLMIMFYPLMLISQDSLEDVIKECKGVVGVHALNVGSLKSFSLNEDEFFPMASTRKIVLAAIIFDLINKKKLYLEDTVFLTAYDIAPGSGILKNVIKQQGNKVYSIKDLMGYMMRDSDNTATQYLMDLCGGHGTFDTWLQEQGIHNIIFKTDIKTWLQRQAFKTIWYQEAQETILQSPDAPRYIKWLAYLCSFFPEPTAITFSDESTNIATPKALNMFLKECFDKDSRLIPNSEHQNILKTWMQECNTGKDRIKKYLPDCSVYHKTGTGVMGVCNNAGVIESNDKDTTIAMTIFIKDSMSRIPSLEENIANIARALYMELSK